MTHDQATTSDYVDGYVRGALDQATRAEFEAHYFECDVCFAALEEAERLRSAVAVGVANGWLSPPVAAPVHRWAWLAAAAALLLGAGLGWAMLYRIPQLQADLVEARAETTIASARVEPSVERLPEALVPEANVPALMLRAERDARNLPVLAVPAGAARFVLLIEAPIGIDSARLEIGGADSGPVTGVPGLVASSSGVFVASLPAVDFPAGAYHVRLIAPGGLVGEFLIRIERGR